MKELSINDVLEFFRHLSFKDKVEVLNQFTMELKRGIEKQQAETEVSNQDELIDELFGIWKSEEALTEETIIDRTMSDREISLD